MRRRKPNPADFSLPASFDFPAFDKEEEAWDKKSKWYRRYNFIILHIAINLLIAFLFYKYDNASNYIDHSFNSRYGSSFYLAVVLSTATPAVFVLNYIYNWVYNELILERIVPPDIKRQSDLVKAYRQALADWEYLNLETGEGFWKALRGDKFEDALARLFQRRGVSVEKTKKTGDGGVDLILRSGSEVIFVQCKGYAKPVPVAPIREIAGVCSKSRSRPVVAAVNGFTKGAKECARELNVTLIDAPGIVRMAGLDSLDASKL